MSGAFAACGADGRAIDESASANDAGVVRGSATGPRADSGALDAAQTGAVEGAAPGQTPPSCRAILAAAPGSTTGSYIIDPDGAGGELGTFAVHCDMAFDGGGWTLIYSNLAGRTLDEPGNAATGAAADTGYYHNLPAPKVHGMFRENVVAVLAASASQVHIRSPFDVRTGAGSAYITSVTPASGGVSLPMKNLRALKLLNADGDGGFAADWSGPNATAASLDYENSSPPCTTLNSMRYPSLYWACDNSYGLHLTSASARWVWVEPNHVNEDLQVYIR